MTTPNRFKMIASSYLFLIKNNRILLSRRYKTGYEDGKYSVPAGHVEAGETLTQTLAREVKEEIGITLDNTKVKLVHVMHRKYNDIRIDFFFTVSAWIGKPYNREPNKCDDLKWFPVSDLPSNTIPYIRKAIECYCRKQIHSEFGWD